VPKNDKICEQALQVFQRADGHFKIQLDIVTSDLEEAKKQANRLAKIVDENGGDEEGIVVLNKDKFMADRGPGVADTFGLIPIPTGGKPN
jgi:hypothetical protein